ncbi:MAG: bifunctional nuclease family protein [Nitrospiraceae bacterium]
MASKESSELIELKVDRLHLDQNTETHIVILRSDEHHDTLPIWVGAAEGNAIRLAMESVVTPRPMSHDLIRSFADHLTVKIERVVVTDVKNSTYYATIYLTSKGVERTLDARPSDAIALALRTRCPIYVTDDVMKRRSGNNLDAWIAKLDTKDLGAQEV